MPMAEICTHWTIAKDQLIRLRDVWHLPKRHDRSLRYRPPRDPGPDDEEERASRESLSLAPQIAARATCVQALWTEQQRRDRTMATTPSGGMLRWINAKDIVQRFADDELQG
jgi:hypothetical protein